MSENKLLPCPFCGGKADLFSWSQTPFNYQYGIECRECHTLFQINQYDTTMQDTIKQWNTRKPMERIIERICNVRNNTPSTEFKNGCNACLGEIHRYIDSEVKEVGGIE